MLSIFFFLYNLAVVFGCYGAYYDEEPPREIVTTTTTTPPVFKEDDLDRNLAEAWGGFTPPLELEEVWRKWLDDYKAERKLEETGTDKKYQHERGPNSGWPPSWKGINGGFDGAEPPPWAYHPINTGLPDFCYLPPRKGNCKENLTRWAFNPYAAECNEFIYSGCDENQNNFIERVKCEETCMKTPVSGCDPETQQYIMDDD